MTPAATVGAVAAAIAAIAAVLCLAAAGWDETRLVRAAPPTADPAATPAGLTVLAPEDGFDGQFFYRLAADPLSDDVTGHGITYDLPSVRSARVGYPAIAWVASLGGRHSAVPWALLAVNVVATGVLAWAASRLVAGSGRSAWWGLVVAAAPGFAYSLSFDLAEIVTCALGACGLLAFGRRRLAAAAGLLAAAALCRESGAVFALGVLASGIVPWRVAAGDRARRLAVGGAATAVFAAWQLVVRARFGSFPLTSSASKNVGFPFGGLAEELDRFTPALDAGVALRLVTLGVLALVFAAGLLGARRAAPERVWAMLGSFAVLSLMSAFVWSGATSFARAGAELVVLGVLVAVHATGRLARPALALTAVTVPTVWAAGLASQLGKI